jgi:hypothetical protein
MHATETESVTIFEGIRESLRGYLASWEARYQSLDDYSVDSRHDLMGSVATVLFEVIRQVGSISSESSIVHQLQDIAASAGNWSTYRVYIDGGTTFRELTNGCHQVLDAVRRVSDEDWD